MEFPTAIIREGEATLLVPKLDGSTKNLDRARSRAPVFYNPRMRLNRDSAVLVLATHQKRLARNVVGCEPLCGTGIRGVRLALEVEGVERILMGDLNPRAVRIAEENASRNGVSDKIEVRLMEANLLLSIHARPLHRFDYIDVDPFGSPTPFLDTAVRACKKGGLVALTATDMAPLCGVNPRACLRKYGGRPLRTEYSHEQALRLLAGALATTCARHETSMSPVFSYSADHYVRLYARLERGARKADQSLNNMGFILHCRKCSNRRAATLRVEPDSYVCDVCGSRMMEAGPMWVGSLADPTFCEGMIEASEGLGVGGNGRLMSFVRMVKEETSFSPGYFEIDGICSRIGAPSQATDRVLSALIERGFSVTRTHFEDRGIKTDATIAELEHILTEVYTDEGGRTNVA